MTSHLKDPISTLFSLYIVTESPSKCTGGERLVDVVLFPVTATFMMSLKAINVCARVLVCLCRLLKRWNFKLANQFSPRALETIRALGNQDLLT